MQGSRVLRGVIATLLSVGFVSPESGESYCTQDGLYCHVYGNDPDTEPADEYPDEPNWLGGDSTSVDPYCTDAGCNDRDASSVCKGIADVKPPDCNLFQPPKLIPDGCGSGITTNLVPDSLVVPYAIVNPFPNPIAPYWTFAPFGTIFTSACNNHDSCYGTLAADKAQCDRKLHTDMVDNALIAIPKWEQEKYMPWADSQAVAYSFSLRHPFVSFVASQSAFDTGQAGAKCRALAKQYEMEGCHQ